MMEAEVEVKSTIAAVNLLSAKTKAEFWSVRMAAAKTRAEEIALESDETCSWTKVRVESQKLVNLSAAHLALEEEMTKSQNMCEDYSRMIKIHKTSVALVKRDLAEKGKERGEERNTIEKQLIKETMMLKRIEAEMVIIRKTLKLMKDALDCWRTAVGITKNVVLRRILSVKEDYVELTEIADLSTLQFICAHSYILEGLLLKFWVGKSVENELLQLFSAAVSLLEKEGITIQSNRLYQLSIDDKGIYHFSQLRVKEEATNCNYGFKQ